MNTIVMEEQGGGGSRSRGSLRTRSQVAPDWTVQESLILVNEISVVESDCLNTFSSFQKWKIIVENCNALEVNRGLNQCRRKWDSLLADYRKIKHWESRNTLYLSLDAGDRRKLQQQLGIPVDFDTDLFKAIDCHIRAPEEDLCDTDPDTDPEAVAEPEAESEFDLLINSLPRFGPKKQRRKMIPQKRVIEENLKPRKRTKNEKIKPEQFSLEEVEPRICSKNEKIKTERCSSEDDKMAHPTDIVDERRIPEETNQEAYVQIMAAQLCENAELITGILQGHLDEGVGYDVADLRNIEAIQTDFTRRQGDQLIFRLGNLAEILDKFCDLVQGSG